LLRRSRIASGKPKGPQAGVLYQTNSRDRTHSYPPQTEIDPRYAM
jgi:hypothetical protein